MFLVLKLLVFYIWCCDGMLLGVQVMSACLVDVLVAGRVAIATRPVNIQSLHIQINRFSKFSLIPKHT